MNIITRTDRSMPKMTLAFATSVVLALAGASYAQAPADAGSATGNMNNPSSVKSNNKKADARTVGSSTSDIANPGGRSSDHNGTAHTLGKGTRPDGSPATPPPR